MPDAKEGRNVGEKGLRGANVARSLVSADVLLSCLHGHAVGGVSMDVFRDTDDSTWHLSLKLVFASEVGGMRATEAHRDTEPLDTATPNVSSHLTCRLADGQGEDVLKKDGAHLVLPQAREQLCEIFHVANVVRGLNEDASKLICSVPREVLDLAELEVHAQGSGPCLDHVYRLVEDAIGDEDLSTLEVVRGECHSDSLCSSSAFVEEGSIRDIQPSQLCNHSLEVEKHF